MVARSPRSASTWSISRARSCIATSLKASVGPWNSSRIAQAAVELDQRRDGRVAEAGVGVAGHAGSSSRGMSPPVNGWITSTAISANGLPANAAIVSGENCGQVSGT